ncbi:MAG: hypothetical protein ACI4QE_03940 [Acutalibacteraceae bacterium]
MTERDAWNAFLQSGYVNDYLEYKSIQKAKRACLNKRGNDDKIQNESSDSSGTEYRRKR